MLDKNSLQKIGFALAAVMELFFLSLAGLGIGFLLDKKVLNAQTTALTLVFGVLGMSLGFYRLYRFYVQVDKSENKSDPK